MQREVSYLGKGGPLVFDEAYKKGFYYEANFSGCAQSTIAAVSESLSLLNEDVFRSASALSAGLSLRRTGSGPCGAFLAGLLLFSSLYGRSYKDFCHGKKARGLKDRILAMELELKFTNKYKSINCRNIQMELFGHAFNLANPLEYAEFEKEGGHLDKCPSVVGNASKWIVELLS